MGIETSLERIASSLERIASTLEANTTINDWYKNHLASKEAAKVEAALAEAHVEAAKVETVLAEAHVEAPAEPAPAPAAPAAPEMSYDELKAFLIARGVEIPKGTKMTTLKKLYEKHKDTAPLRSTPRAENVAAMQPLPPQGVPASEDPADLFDKPADPFGLPAAAPAPEQKPAMTKDEAAARIRAHYQATEEDRKAFIEALAAAGVPAGGSFQDVEDGKFDVLVETYERIKGVVNA